MSFKVSKTNMCNSKGQTGYTVTCSLTNEVFDFSPWTKANAHSTQVLIMLINNIGYFTQKIGAFVKFTWEFRVTYTIYK